MRATKPKATRQDKSRKKVRLEAISRLRAASPQHQSLAGMGQAERSRPVSGLASFDESPSQSLCSSVTTSGKMTHPHLRTVAGAAQA
jgi:ADP-ribosylglycohydrolase